MYVYGQLRHFLIYSLNAKEKPDRKGGFKVHLIPNFFFSAEMKLSNIHNWNLPSFLVSDFFKGFKN